MDGASIGLLVGFIVGFLLLGIAIGFFVHYCWTRDKRQRTFRSIRRCLGLEAPLPVNDPWPVPTPLPIADIFDRINEARQAEIRAQALALQADEEHLLNRGAVRPPRPKRTKLQVMFEDPDTRPERLPTPTSAAAETNADIESAKQLSLQSDDLPTDGESEASIPERVITNWDEITEDPSRGNSPSSGEQPESRRQPPHRKYPTTATALGNVIVHRTLEPEDEAGGTSADKWTGEETVAQALSSKPTDEPTAMIELDTLASRQYQDTEGEEDADVSIRAEDAKLL